MAWSTKKRRGRPKVHRTPHDYGNERVQARGALFRHLKGDSSIGFETTCCGRLMLVGAFDGLPETPESYLSALLAYSDGYWSNYGGGPNVADYERRDRSYDHSWEDPRGEWFDAMDARLRDAGHEVRKVVHQASVDAHWFPDSDAPWAERIINARLWKDVQFASERDWSVLELLRLGAMALVGQPLRRAA